MTPIEIRVTDDGGGTSHAFHFPIGFAVIEGHFAAEQTGNDTEAADEHGRHLRYFRIRDHLRRMGLGRCGLECLWREDVDLNVDPFKDIYCLIEEADPQRLLRLWYSVLAAVPDEEIKRAHKLLDPITTQYDKQKNQVDLSEHETKHLAEAEQLLLGALPSRVQVPETRTAITGCAKSTVE